MAAPCYTGDDRAIIYSQADAATASGFSLVRQPLAEDLITAVGDPEPWLDDGVLGVIYRRGEFTGPRVPGICVGDCSANGLVTVNELVTGVNLALGRMPVSACGVFDVDGDGTVSIDELVGAVADALQGC